MKKISLLLVALSAIGLISCGKQYDPDAINISCVRLGYGTQWLKNLMAEYTAETGVKFNYTEVDGQSGNNNLNDNLRSYAGSSDIYGLRPNVFFELLYRGKIQAKGQQYDTAFEPLTDIYQEEFAGEQGNNTMEKKIDKQFLNYVNFKDNYFAVPWANGFQSFVRNTKVWTKFGYDADFAPRTTDEFFEIMDAMNAKIASDPKTYGEMAPLIFSETAEYYSTIVGAWVAQYEGSENIQNLYQGFDPRGKRSYNMFTFPGITEAIKIVAKMVQFNNKTNSYIYHHPQSSTLPSHTFVQDAFASDKAAFCVNGTWLEIENETFQDPNYDYFDYIKIPLISSITKKLSKDYTDADLRAMVDFVDAHPVVGDNNDLPAGVEAADIEIVRDARLTGSIMRTDYDHLFVIPSWASKKEEAKKFLKWIYSDKALQIFYDTMNGHHLPALPSTGSYDTSKVTLTKFRKSANKLLDEGFSCPYLINTAKEEMFCLANVSPTFHNSINQPTKNFVTWLINGSTAGDVVAENTNYLKDSWSVILNAIGRDE